LFEKTQESCALACCVKFRKISAYDLLYEVYKRQQYKW